MHVKNKIKSMLNTAIPTSKRDLYMRKHIVKIELNITRFFLFKTILSIKTSLILKNTYLANIIISSKTEIKPPLT